MTNLQSTLLTSQEQSEPSDQLEMSEQSQEIIENIERNENIIETRIEDINKLGRGVQEVNELFIDVSLLTQHQGNQIDNIEVNIQKSDKYINNATTELIKANKYHKRKKNVH